MATIDIGTRNISIDRGSAGSYTFLNLDNPANGNGTISTAKIYTGATVGNAKIGTFYGSGTSWTNRDYASIGSVTGGSEQTFSGLTISVQTNDAIGFYSDGFSQQSIVIGVAGTGTRCYKAGDQFDAGTQAYTTNDKSQWIYGEGSTPVGAPNAPTTPSPSDGGTGECEDQQLTCVVTDPGSSPMDVSFYDQSDDSLIGTDSSVASGGTAKIVWEGLTPSTSYTWYAVADNGSATTQGANWSFTSGTDNGYWNMSSNDSWRFYSLGYKILEWTSTALTFIKNVVLNGTLTVDGESLFKNKIKLTQTDGNEYIDSLADGYMDYGATTAHRLNNNVILGAGAAGVDYTLTFDGETNDGVITWMEDEDYFKFDDSILFPDNEPLYFGTGADTSIYYDGTDLKLVTDNVAASDLVIDCGTDKTVELTETVWDDQQVNLGNSRFFGVSDPTWTSYKGSEVLAFNKSQDNELAFNMQMSHRLKQGTNIEFHLHDTPADDTAGVVRWVLTVSKADIDSDFPAPTTYTAEQTITANTADKHILFDISDNIGSDSQVSSFYLMSLKREGTHANDTYNNDIYLIGMDAHYEIDTLGSRQEMAK